MVSTLALTLVPWGWKPGLEPDRPHGHGVVGWGGWTMDKLSLLGRLFLSWSLSVPEWSSKQDCWILSVPDTDESICGLAMS